MSLDRYQLGELLTVGWNDEMAARVPERRSRDVPPRDAPRRHRVGALRPAPMPRLALQPLRRRDKQLRPPQLPRPTPATGEPPVTRDKSSRTLTAGQLIAQLLKVPADTPVVMSQEDEPVGCYGVRSVELEEMRRDPTYADGPFGRDSWHSTLYSCAGYDPPQQVVFLGPERPWQPTIDGEPERPAIESGDRR
ncbi:hypothetical protein SEA_ANDIES_60 [Mycobacterium phage Andies]|uniref:Uncharacterized protein n=1 Tax=Mycobacterium phage Andies TaxID=2047834 RepID=A0A2H4PFU4_9CAUD|nr:hypothetical protein KD931_gp60 [Mycobacterium phage Andies]ATW61093.1 hypothetical protein SEA_ANDIES_60 [Mycobacterium phage Andies]